MVLDPLLPVQTEVLQPRNARPRHWKKLTTEAWSAATSRDSQLWRRVPSPLQLSGVSAKEAGAGHEGGPVNPRPDSGHASLGLPPTSQPQAPLPGQLWARRVPPCPARPRAHLAEEAGRAGPGAGPGQEQCSPVASASAAAEPSRPPSSSSQAGRPSCIPLASWQAPSPLEPPSSLSRSGRQSRQACAALRSV